MRLTLGIIVGIICGSPGWKSNIILLHILILLLACATYFDHITVLQVLKCRTSVKGGAHMCCQERIRMDN